MQYNKDGSEQQFVKFDFLTGKSGLTLEFYSSLHFRVSATDSKVELTLSQRFTKQTF